MLAHRSRSWHQQQKWLRKGLPSSTSTPRRTFSSTDLPPQKKTIKTAGISDEKKRLEEELEKTDGTFRPLPARVDHEVGEGEGFTDEEDFEGLFDEENGGEEEEENEREQENANDNIDDDSKLVPQENQETMPGKKRKREKDPIRGEEERRREAWVRLARDVATEFMEKGAEKIKAHDLFSVPDPDVIVQDVLLAKGKDEKGKDGEKLNAVTTRAASRIQEVICRVRQDIRKRVTLQILLEKFGVDLSEEESNFSLWELISLLACLKMDVKPTVADGVLQGWVTEVQQEVTKVASQAHLFAKNVHELTGSELQKTRIRDLVHAPGKWVEFVSSDSSNSGRNRRELISEIERTYKDPIRRRLKGGGRADVMHYLFEIDDILHVIETLIDPLSCSLSLPQEVLLRDEHMLFFEYERLESIRLIVEKSLTLGTIFLRLCRMTPASRNKDLAAIEKEAAEQAKIRDKEREKEKERTPMSREKGPFLQNVHSSSSAPPYPRQFSAGRVTATPPSPRRNPLRASFQQRPPVRQTKPPNRF